MTTFLDPLNNADDMLHSVRSELITIAAAFEVVGNHELGAKLRTLAAFAYQAQKDVQAGRTMALNTHVSGAEQATANMVKAALAVTGG